MLSVESTIDVTKALILAVLQGVAEFLPISSSGHLALFQYAMNLEDLPTFFDVMLHVGTLIAVVWYYRRIFRPEPGDFEPGDMPALADPQEKLRLAWWLFLGMVPAVGVKLLFLLFKRSKPGEPPSLFSQIDDMRETASARPWLVLSFLLCTSVVLLIASRARSGGVDAGSMRWYHALAIGVAQAFSAMCPGLSRSGMTISTSLMMGLKGSWAVNFSLLLTIPVILAAAVYEGRHVDPAWIRGHIAPTAVGVVVSAAVGWASIGLLARTVQRGRWVYFAVYLWVLVPAVALALKVRQ